MPVLTQKTNFFSDIYTLFKKEKIHLQITQNDPQQIQINVTDNSWIIKFKLDAKHHELLYDIYLPQYLLHLNTKNLFDFNKIYSLYTQHEKKIPEYIPDIWTLFDIIEHWVIKKRYYFKHKDLT